MGLTSILARTGTRHSRVSSTRSSSRYRVRVMIGSASFQDYLDIMCPDCVALHSIACSRSSRRRQGGQIPPPPLFGVSLRSGLMARKGTGIIDVCSAGHARSHSDALAHVCHPSVRSRPKRPMLCRNDRASLAAIRPCSLQAAQSRSSGVPRNVDLCTLDLALNSSGRRCCFCWASDQSQRRTTQKR